MSAARGRTSSRPDTAPAGPSLGRQVGSAARSAPLFNQPVIRAGLYRATGAVTVTKATNQMDGSRLTFWRVVLAGYLVIYLAGLHWPNLSFGGTSVGEAARLLPGHLSWYLHSAGHLVLAVLALTALPRWRTGRRPVGLAVGLMLLATATEVGQVLVPGRSPSVLDLCFNGIGIAAGVLLMGLIRVLRNPRSPRDVPEPARGR